MKRILSMTLLTLAVAACSQQHSGHSPLGLQDSRTHVPLADGWKFLKAAPADAQATPPALSTGDWQAVTVPHTWNNLDGQDGGNNYLRTTCWYERDLDITPAMAGKTLVLKFLGVNRQADVYLNGEQVGTHLGGFAAFTIDITHAAHPGRNVLAVRVSNKSNDASPPLSADFTFFGGIYRPAELLVLNPVHISPLEMGSPGIAISTPTVTDDAAAVQIRTLVQNTLTQPQALQVAVDITDAAGHVVAHTASDVTVASITEPVQQSLTVPHPHRWDGLKDPYLYRVTVNVARDGKMLDSLTQPLGIRTFHIDKQKGFFLNDHPYHLHGVNRHQDRLDMGWAISDREHEEDMALIKEMGCTAIRLAHYQHSETFYELCDKVGMVVWAEVPVVNEVKPTEAFADNAEQQLKELIRQNINHPSICFWSVGNEVRKGDPIPLYTAMNAIAHKEDPSRITTVAFAQPKLEGVVNNEYNPKWFGITDTYGQNRYSGWYQGNFKDFAAFIHQEPSAAISEYGAGGSIYFHSETPHKMDHSEEYECLFHEAYWPAIHEAPQIWGSYIWNMFDFAADQRREGDHAGRNDKGMVTYDRKTKKDVFYYYKANWSDEPTLHLTSKRFHVRGLQAIPIKVYANTEDVELLVNGRSLGRQTGTYGTFVWRDVQLHEGENTVVARGSKDGHALEDHCTFVYKPGAPLEVDIAQDESMTKALQNGPPRAPKDAPTTRTAK